VSSACNRQQCQQPVIRGSSVQEISVSTPWEVPSPCRLDNRMFSNSNEKYMQLASLNGVTEKQMAHSQTRVTANKK